MSNLSLVAEFDDMVRNRAVLSSGIETDVMKFVLNQELCRKRWLETEKNYMEYLNRFKELEQDNEALKTKLKHARSQIEHEMNKRQRIEQERDSFERQIAVVRELLTDKNRTVLDDKDRERLAFLSTDFQNSHDELSPRRNLTTIDESGSILSPSDISYDRTEEDLDGTRARGRLVKRPSAPLEDDVDDVTSGGKRSRRDVVRKRHRRSNSADLAMAAAADVARSESPSDTDRRLRRYSTPGPRAALHSVDSTSTLNQIDDEYDDRGLLGSVRKRAGTVSAVSPASDTMTLKRFGSGNSLNRVHVFMSKNFYKSDLCAACGKKPRFGSKVLKCKECRAVAHLECRDNVPLPCIPTPVTPSKNPTSGYISEYVSADPPMIPALVIRCVEEVTIRGLNTEGIYRVPGSDKEVKELKEKFLKGKTLPNLNLVSDIHVVCGCLKDFLRGLKEPLVTFRLWNLFANAVEKTDTNESTSDFYQAINELPQPNRDTLAYIVLHLQKVADSPGCKMPIDNLATVFGPTIIGYSSAEPTMNHIMTQTKTQQQIIKRLMSIPSEYWSTFTNIDLDFERHARDFSTPKTEESVNFRRLSKYDYPPSGKYVAHGLLGPVDSAMSAPVSRKAGASVRKAQHFFDSPDLK